LSKWYVAGNYVAGNETVTVDNWNGGVQPQEVIPLDSFRLAYPLPFASVRTESAQDALTSVLTNVGCNFPTRDSADLRVIDEVLTGSAAYGATYNGGLKGIIDSQRDVGGWPAMNSVTPAVDSDHDGMPDSWETANGLNPNDAADRNNLSAQGYTMLEVYLNSLVPDLSTSVADQHLLIQETVTLSTNYPNPFNPTTTIGYQLPAEDRVVLKVYDIFGREVKTLVDARQSSGTHRVQFDGRQCSSGTYYARLQAGGMTQTIKLVLLK
jgi:hypothetical protein